MSQYDVFISYSVKNTETAFRLVECLERHGLRCWIAPRNISQGSRWAEEINEAIEQCEHFVLVYSRESEASNQVPKEVGLAADLKKKMIPFRLDGTELTGVFKYYLNDCQIVDAEGQLDEKMEELAEELERLRDLAVQKKERKSNAGLRHGKQKRLGLFIVAVVAAAAVICVAVFFFGRKNSDVRKYDPYRETIFFSADSDMTVGGFEEDKQVLVNRVKRLFGEEIDVEEDAEHFRIQVSLPLEKVSSLDVSALLDDYVTIPGELYIANAEDGYAEYLKIPRDEIKDVKLCHGRIPDLDMSEYDMEEQDEYQYIAVTVSDYLAESVESAAEGWNGVYVMTDIDLANLSNTITDDARIIVDGYYTSKVAVVMEQGKQICFYPMTNNIKTAQLLVNILQEKPMTGTFSSYSSIPACWETKKDSIAYGENQKSVERLKGDTIDVVYTTKEQAALSDGQWMDAREEWKKRLDCIGIPYAFGTDPKGNGKVVVRFLLKDVNEELLGLLAWQGISSFEVTGLSDSDAFYAFKDFTYQKQSDGTYVAEMHVFDRLTGEELGDLSSEDVRIPVRISILGAEVPVLSGTAKQGTVSFTGSVVGRDGQITEKALPFLQIISYLINDAPGTFDYSYKEGRPVICSLEDAERSMQGEITYGLTYDKTLQEYDDLMQKISENRELASYVKSVRMQFDGSCSVTMELKTDDTFAGKVTAYTKFLLQDCGLEKVDSVTMYFIDESVRVDGERARFIYRRTATDKKTSLDGYFFGERIDRHTDELQRLLTEDAYLNGLGVSVQTEADFDW